LGILVGDIVSRGDIVNFEERRSGEVPCSSLPLSFEWKYERESLIFLVEAQSELVLWSDYCVKFLSLLLITIGLKGSAELVVGEY
jgi:hypothetical protein